MKILHLADLHLGKRVNEMSMIEDQKYILDQIITLIKEESVGIVLLCGDIYDKSIPTIEAIHLLDEFLDQLSKMAIKVLMISGNHDSIDRLSFGKSLFTRSNLYIASQFENEIEKITVKENGITVNFYMLPFVKVGGRCICMKSFEIEEELKEAKKAIEILGGEIEKIDEITLPNTDIKRKIVVIKKVKNTPSKYPRKAGTPAKEPII